MTCYAKCGPQTSSIGLTWSLLEMLTPKTNAVLCVSYISSKKTEKDMQTFRPTTDLKTLS